MTTTESLLQQALTHHREGRLTLAQQGYEAALNVDPAHGHALYLLGTLEAQKGGSERAISLLRRAIAVRPDIADAHYNLGLLLKADGCLEEAAASYRRSLDLRPGLPEA